jgi:hypothetical protein
VGPEYQPPFPVDSADSSARFYYDAQIIGLQRTFPDPGEMLETWTCAQIRSAQRTGLDGTSSVGAIRNTTAWPSSSRAKAIPCGAHSSSLS